MSREHKPHAPKIQRIELSEKHIKTRWILVCVLVAIAVIAILIGIFGSRQKPGWYTVESASNGLHCGHEFLLNYEYGTGDMSATKEQKELQKLYTALTEKAWQLFYSEAGESQWGNLHRINTHPNEEVSIDPALYQAFKVLEQQKSRLHYLGPVYGAYDPVFWSTEPVLAAQIDPGQDDELRRYVQELARFAADPNAIRLELRQNSKVYLYISDEYEAFMKENMEEVYIDFGWLRSAFVIDYMAGRLEENGFTTCNITSIDGFSRNLDRRGGNYQLNIFNRHEGVTERAASMEYRTPASTVYLRTYDSSKVRTFQNGRVVTYMVDLADGQCKAALPNLVSYSQRTGCAEIALAIAPTFIAESFTADGLNDLTDAGIYSIWFEGQALCHNQPDLVFPSKNDAYTITPIN